MSPIQLKIQKIEQTAFKYILIWNRLQIKGDSEENIDIIQNQINKRESINESDIELTDAMKEVTKLSAKFCPMPNGPLDLYDLFI